VEHKNDFLSQLSQYDIDQFEIIAQKFQMNIICLFHLADGRSMGAEKMSKKLVLALRGYVDVIGKVKKKNEFLLQLSGYDLNALERIA